MFQDGVVTRYDEFLKDANSPKSTEAEEPEPVVKVPLSQRAAVSGLGNDGCPITMVIWTRALQDMDTAKIRAKPPANRALLKTGS